MVVLSKQHKCILLLDHSHERSRWLRASYKGESSLAIGLSQAYIVGLHLQTGSPSDFLKAVVGEAVIVRLNSGVDYRGALYSPLSSCMAKRKGQTYRDLDMP